MESVQHKSKLINSPKLSDWVKCAKIHYIYSLRICIGWAMWLEMIAIAPLRGYSVCVAQLTLFSPSMTMTGTEVWGQRCFEGRGLSQFHRTMIWKTERRHTELLLPPPSTCAASNLISLWAKTTGSTLQTLHPACCWINPVNMWHLRTPRPANVTLLQTDWTLKSQKGSGGDKIFPIMFPEWFVQLSPS